MRWYDIVGLVGSFIAITQAIWYVAKWIKSRPQKEKKLFSRRDYSLGIFFALLCAALWSISFTSLSYVSIKADPLEINIIILGVASIFYFLAFYLYSPIVRVISKKEETTAIEYIEWRRLGTWLVIGGNIASFLLFIYALYFISASQTIALQKINPIFVAILAGILLKQKISWSAWLAVLLVVIGILLIVCDLSQASFKLRTGDDITGSILAIVAGLSFAFFSIGLELLDLSKRSYKYHFKFFSVVFFLSFVCVITVAYFRGDSPSSDWLGFLILLANGLRVTLVYIFYCASVERIGALLASIFVSVEVFLTMLWDTILLERAPTATLFLGAIIIVAGGLSLLARRMTPGEA